MTKQLSGKVGVKTRLELVIQYTESEKIEIEIYSATFKERLPSHAWKSLLMPA